MTVNTKRKGFWVSAVLLTFSAIVVLLFLMYAFVQKAEAEKQKENAQSFANEAATIRQLCEEENKSLLDSIMQLHSKIDSLRNHGEKRR